MKKFAFLIVACAVAVGCNSQASAPETPEVTVAVAQYVQTIRATPPEALGDVIYFANGNVIRVDNISEFESRVAALEARNELYQISRVVERAETAEYAAAVNDSYVGRVDQQ